MSDSSLIRCYSGSRFRLADSIRQEQAEWRPNQAEQFLHTLAGRFTANKKISRQTVNHLNKYIQEETRILRYFAPNEWAMRLPQAIDNLKQQPHDFSALAKVLSCVGLAAEHTLGYFPHPVQFFGAYTLLSGSLAQMQTGEGKTLVAALAATIAAVSGAYVHVLSTNDYLATRDEEEMRPLFAFFGLVSSSIHSKTEYEQRHKAYRQNICYVPAKEIVFDYLKDNLSEKYKHSNCLQYIYQLQQSARQKDTEPMIPALHFCIVDEADSILVDEARTPLIISRKTDSLIEPELLKWAIDTAGSLKESVHFTVNHTQRDIMLMPSKLQHISAPPEQVRSIWQNTSWQKWIIRQALRAIYLYHPDKHYLIQDQKIQIIDEATGRLMPDRSWEQGLHQLIETKEGLPISQDRETLAKVTFQRFFRQYFLLSGLTGTATEVAHELWTVYHLRVCDIPPNKPNQRTYFPIRCSSSLKQKWEMVAQDAINKAQQGQAVLIGTRSVEASECVAKQLTAYIQDGIEIDFVILNARQDQHEAEIIAQAGQPHRITVATNMAGRGTDIKLNAAVKQVGGLHVILTEYHESARIDRQLIGRCGRQGDVGTVQVIVSFEDELLLYHCPILCKAGKSVKPAWLAAWWAVITAKLAQHTAQQQHRRIRMQTLKQDRELNKQIGFAGKIH
ncbi:preprotein translocase subunit SecA [Conchiformibius steedae]|uniref:Preprotein translocase subunit SecA n=1 Tax=Conchiformibius steedae TaxID=153493 RepID=A0A3P2A259_9NEIS|nr:DEAD/DEAH box helicase [Conchiformibius steedae]RRD88946.1 preprotein translocase subunit SecA [Conchiformibius steedae]